MRRMILVLADGLRPDAISPTIMPSLDALGDSYTLALHAHTVRPSATVAALASLATGVAPETHRLTEPGLGFLPGLGALRPVARELARIGIPTDVVTSELSGGAHAIASALCSAAGVRAVRAAGHRARETAKAAHRLLSAPEERLVFVYLPDCDSAGHAHGWMSLEYLEAAVEVDAAIGLLSGWTDDAVLIVASDHGGGGCHLRSHDERHPANERIPLIVAGPGVTRRHLLTRPVSLLDIPPTVLWLFGADVPASYQGRVLAAAFARPTVPA